MLISASKSTQNSRTMSRFTWLIDNGHGGKIKGKYQTPGKSFTHPNGFKIEEGVVNRKIAARLLLKLIENDIEAFLITPDLTDTTLTTRITRANKFHNINKQCVFVSIHCNAGKGNGFEVFTSPGETKSDKIASQLIKEYERLIPEFYVRKDYSDGDSDKEARFRVLTKTRMPAILSENLFMDTLSNANFLASSSGLDRIAEAHFQMILAIEKNGIR